MQPEPIAPKVRAQIAELGTTLARLEEQAAETSLEELRGVSGAAKALASNMAAIEAARSLLAVKRLALTRAEELDQGGEAARIAAARALPAAKAIAGITGAKCPSACSATSCALAGGLPTCMHPHKGGVPPQHANDRVLRNFNAAAREEITSQLAEANLG